MRGISRPYLGYWTIVIKASQLFRFEMTIQDIKERSGFTFDFEVDELILDTSEPTCTIHFRCTEEEMKQICSELKSVCIDIL